MDKSKYYKNTLRLEEHAQRKGRDWFEAMYGIEYDQSMLIKLIDRCNTDEPLELLWRYLAVRQANALKTEDFWCSDLAVAYAQQCNINARGMAEYYHEISQGIAATQNFMKVMLGLNVLDRWGPDVPL